MTGGSEAESGIPEKLKKCFGKSHDCLARCGQYEVEKCPKYEECRQVVRARCDAQSQRFDRMAKYVPKIALQCEMCGAQVKTSATGLYCDCTAIHLPNKWFTTVPPGSTLQKIV